MFGLVKESRLNELQAQVDYLTAQVQDAMGVISRMRHSMNSRIERLEAFLADKQSGPIDDPVRNAEERQVKQRDDAMNAAKNTAHSSKDRYMTVSAFFKETGRGNPACHVVSVFSNRTRRLSERCEVPVVKVQSESGQFINSYRIDMLERSASLAEYYCSKT